MRAAVEKRILGEFSHMFREMLRSFFGTRLNSGGELFFWKAKLAANIVDMKAHQRGLDVKGSSGWKCCIKCKNVLNVDATRIDHHDWLKHHSMARLRDCDTLRDEDYWLMSDILEKAHSQLPPSKFADLEKLFGLNYNPHGVLQDKHLRSEFLPVSHTMEDWAHCAFASGGFAQYHLQGFCLALQAVRSDLVGTLDTFAVDV
jgi:hypothetical protein